MPFVPLGLLFAGGVILTLGDIVMKKWVQTNSLGLYVGGLIIYLVGLNFLAQSFRYKNIAIASVIFVLFNIITLTLVSHFYFKESLSQHQIFALIAGLVVITVLELV